MKFSKGASLSSMTLSDGFLSPEFSQFTTSYTATVTSATLTISVLPEIASSIVKINGKQGLTNTITFSSGTNTIIVDVAAPDGNRKQYTVTVTCKWIHVFVQIKWDNIKQI